jgi:hypothetical protein
MYAYKYLALRAALLTLFLAVVYACTRDLWTGVKVFMFVTFALQPVFIFLFRREILEAWRNRRER